MRTLAELMADRSFMLKVIWIAMISSLFFIGLGVILILQDIFG